MCTQRYILNRGRFVCGAKDATQVLRQQSLSSATEFHPSPRNAWLLSKSNHLKVKTRKIQIIVNVKIVMLANINVVGTMLKCNFIAQGIILNHSKRKQF